MRQNEYFPCDLILINSSAQQSVSNSSSQKGFCYVETKNLDGETNLKHKVAPDGCPQLSSSEENLCDNFTGGEIECDNPNTEIYNFRGTMRANG